MKGGLDFRAMIGAVSVTSGLPSLFNLPDRHRAKGAPDLIGRDEAPRSAVPSKSPTKLVLDPSASHSSWVAGFSR